MFDLVVWGIVALLPVVALLQMAAFAWFRARRQKPGEELVEIESPPLVPTLNDIPSPARRRLKRGYKPNNSK